MLTPEDLQSRTKRPLMELAVHDMLVDYEHYGRPHRVAVLSVVVQQTPPLQVSLLQLVHGIRMLSVQATLVLSQVTRHIKMHGGGHDGLTFVLEELKELQDTLRDDIEEVARAYQSGLSLFDPRDEPETATHSAV